MATRHTYKDNIILELAHGGACFFLFDADGDVNEYSAKSLTDAKARIDDIEKSQGGLYNADGELA